MNELVAQLSATGRRLEELGSLGLFDCLEHVIGSRYGRFQHANRESEADHGGQRQDLLGRWTQTIEAPRRDQSDPLRHLEMGNVDVCPPATVVIEESPLFGEMAEGLLDEKDVAFGRFVDRSIQPGWRSRSS